MRMQAESNLRDALNVGQKNAGTGPGGHLHMKMALQELEEAMQSQNVGPNEEEIFKRIKAVKSKMLSCQPTTLQGQAAPKKQPGPQPQLSHSESSVGSVGKSSMDLSTHVET